MKTTPLIATSIAALLAAGCQEREEAEVVTPADEVAVVMPEDDAYPVGSTMSAEQQDNFESFDRDAAMREYETNRDAMASEAMNGMSGTAGGNAAGDAATSNGGMTSDGTGSGTGMAAGASPAPSLRPRSQMDFAFLDRNSDNQLSVAEYAIWAVRANPRTEVPNDETRPFISTDQINEAGQTFFYFDENADSYLSRAEFDMARSSARTP